MTARCFNDSCSIHWSEVTVGSGRNYQGDVQLEPSLQCGGVQGAVSAGSGVGVRLSASAGNILSLSGDGLFAGFPAGQDIQLDGYDDATGANPYVGVGLDNIDANPVYSADHAVTNGTGKDGMLLIKADLALYYRIAPSLGGGDDDSGYPATVATIGGLANVCMYNAQMSAILATGAAANPTFRKERHEFDISGLVRLPAATGSTAEQYKSSVQNVISLLPIAAGATVHFRGGAFYNGPAQRTNIAFSSASQSNPVRGFRLEGIQTAIIPIATS